jgi:homoserine O-acetyltransferase/O-succinyltransferase
MYTIQDMVDAEYRLATEVLHLSRVHAVVGISMGGMQAFDWIVRYPDFMNAAVSIIGSPQETSYDLWWAHLLEQTIQSAPGYADGNYMTQPDVRMAREVGGLVFQSPAWRVAHTTTAEFSKVYAELGGPSHGDANDTVWELRAIMTQDVTGGRSIAEAARQVKAHLLVEVSQDDHAVNPQPAIAWARASNASLYVSQTDCGHNVWDCDKAKIEALAHDSLVAEGVSRQDSTPSQNQLLSFVPDAVRFR